MMLVPAMPTKVVQTHATAFVTQPGASGARARPAEGSWPSGSALPAQTTMADLQVSGAPAVVVFHAMGSEADSLHALDHHRAALHECQIKSAQSSVFHTDFIYVRW
jgi:hypothetical protein